MSKVLFSKTIRVEICNADYKHLTVEELAWLTEEAETAVVTSLRKLSENVNDYDEVLLGAELSNPLEVIVK